jgi:ribosome maturation factor RimP
MITKEQIQHLVENILDPKRQFLVDISVKPGNKIGVAVDNFEGISLDECAEISRKIEAGLDSKNEDFELEVSSPGLTQPFLVIQQYKKNINREVDVLLKNGIKIKVRLISVEENGITVETRKEVKSGKKKKKEAIIENQFIEFEHIKSTKIILPF